MKKETVIYISDNCIELVVGLNDHKDMMKIYDFKKYPFHEGSMINGMIIDENGVKEALTAMKADGHDKVSVILNSTQIINKQLTIPKMKHKQILQFVQDELSTLAEHQGQEMVYDYSYLEPSEEGKDASSIIGCAVEKQLLTTYIELFKSVEIEIETIDIFYNVLLKMLKEVLPAKRGKELVTLLDGNNMVSLLFENGKYRLPYRTRIVSGKETSGFAQEVAMNLSHIYQASKTGDNEAIHKVYIGYLDQQEDVLEAITSTLSVDVEKFPNTKMIFVVNEGKDGKETFQFSDYMLSAGYLLKK